MNIIDTWRIEDGRIVEHWDSIQALDFSMRVYSLISGGDIANSNGVFDKLMLRDRYHFALNCLSTIDYFCNEEILSLTIPAE